MQVQQYEEAEKGKWWYKVRWSELASNPLGSVSVIPVHGNIYKLPVATPSGACSMYDKMRSSLRLLCVLKQWLCIVCGQPEYIIGELNINSVITEPVSVL